MTKNKILLVEDNADNRKLVLVFLKGLACEVEVAENGKVSVEKFITAWNDQQSYDLILMDGYDDASAGWERGDQANSSNRARAQSQAYDHRSSHCE